MAIGYRFLPSTAYSPGFKESLSQPIGFQGTRFYDSGAYPNWGNWSGPMSMSDLLGVSKPLSSMPAKFSQQPQLPTFLAAPMNTMATATPTRANPLYNMGYTQSQPLSTLPQSQTLAYPMGLNKPIATPLLSSFQPQGLANPMGLFQPTAQPAQSLAGAASSGGGGGWFGNLFNQFGGYNQLLGGMNNPMQGIFGGGGGWFNNLFNQNGLDENLLLRALMGY